MSITFECKNCGGELEMIEEGVGKCTSCRSKQPIPKRFDEKYNRANRYRRLNANFDEAAKLYDSIIDENPDEAEAYWGRVLCRYGIEEVEDRNGDYKPTCHRTCETSIMDDTDYKLACEKAQNMENLAYYKSQAELIDTIQRKILRIVQNEVPYDIFISFKDKDDDTKSETEDSKNATILYNELVRKGYNVFFSKVTLRDKLGEDYEPYIYAALKSARIMILVGTKKEYLEAKWVRNEWRRFNDMRLGGEKKKIIVAIAGIAPEEVPYELNTMQFAQMDRMEFLEDIKKNIDLFLGESIEERKQREAQQQFDEFMSQKGIISDSDKARSWLENGKLLLEQKRYAEAINDLTEAIKVNPNLSEAYWCRLLAEKEVILSEVRGSLISVADADDYIRAMNCGTSEEKKHYKEIQELCVKNVQLQTAYVEECNKLSVQYCEAGRKDKRTSLRKKLEDAYSKYSTKVLDKGNILSNMLISIVTIVIFGLAWKGYLSDFKGGWLDLVVGIGMLYIFVYPLLGLICNIKLFKSLTRHKKGITSILPYILVDILIVIIALIVVGQTSTAKEIVMAGMGNTIMFAGIFIMLMQSVILIVLSVYRMFIVPISKRTKLEDIRKAYCDQIEMDRAAFDVQCQEIYQKYSSQNDNQYFVIKQMTFTKCNEKDLKDKQYVA